MIERLLPPAAASTPDIRIVRPACRVHPNLPDGERQDASEVPFGSAQRRHRRRGADTWCCRCERHGRCSCSRALVQPARAGPGTTACSKVAANVQGEASGDPIVDTSTACWPAELSSASRVESVGVGAGGTHSHRKLSGCPQGVPPIVKGGESRMQSPEDKRCLQYRIVR